MRKSFTEKEEMNPFLFDEWDMREKGGRERIRREAIVINMVLLALLGAPLAHSVLLGSNPYFSFTWNVHGIVHSFPAVPDSGYIQLLEAIVGISAGLLIPLTGMLLFYRNPVYFTIFCLSLAYLGSEMTFMADHMLCGEGDLIKTREWDVIFNRCNLHGHSAEIANFTSALGNSIVYIGFFSAVMAFLTLSTTVMIRHLSRVLLYGGIVSLAFVVLFTTQRLEAAIIGVFIILNAPYINLIKRDEIDKL